MLFNIYVSLSPILSEFMWLIFTTAVRFQVDLWAQ